MRMMSSMGLGGLGGPGGGGGGGADGDLEFMPMMQNMMKSLLSKEVLYPSLKEITGKVWDSGCVPYTLIFGILDLLNRSFCVFLSQEFKD